jgi:branched-chain amino acid transport system substrate-binding protein
MRKKAILVLMVAVVSMIGGLTSCKGAEPVTSYKIGVILAQTGNYTGLGLQSLEGIQVIVDEINDGGGINGIPVELVVSDDKSEATEAALAAKKLIEVDKVHVLVAGTVTTVSMSIVPVGNEAEIPTVILSGTALLDDQLGDWVFRPMGEEANYSTMILNYLSQDLGISKYATLIENSGYGQGGKVYLPQLSPDYNLTIVEEQYFDPGATDVAPQLTNIKNSEAQAIFIWGSSPTAAVAVKQAREMGILLPIMATPPQLSPSMIESFGEYYEIEPSLIAITAKIDIWQQLPDSDPDKAMCREFAELCQVEYGHPPAMWSLLGANMIQFIEDGLKRANADPANLEAARSKIRDAFETTENLNILVGVYTMSPEDHFGAVREKMVLVTFKDGKMVYLP